MTTAPWFVRLHPFAAASRPGGTRGARTAMDHLLKLHIQPQPTDSSCGPTCLHAVYDYWDDRTSLHKVIEEVGQLPCGGTLAVHLACHALQRGYDATIFTYNLQLFDPTWFRPTVDLASKLVAQKTVKASTQLTDATDAYLKFLQLGGQLRMEPLDETLIIKALSAETPILCGLSATYLYRESREIAFPPTREGTSSQPDDVGGFPVGHFVVLCGFKKESSEVLVADPLWPNPLATDHIYAAPLSQVAGAILLGIVTYDANLLFICPRTP